MSVVPNLCYLEEQDCDHEEKKRTYHARLPGALESKPADERGDGVNEAEGGDEVALAAVEEELTYAFYRLEITILRILGVICQPTNLPTYPTAIACSIFFGCLIICEDLVPCLRQSTYPAPESTKQLGSPMQKAKSTPPEIDTTFPSEKRI